MRALVFLSVVTLLSCRCGTPIGTDDGGSGGSGNKNGGGIGGGIGGGGAAGGGTAGGGGAMMCVVGATDLSVTPASASVGAGGQLTFTASATVSGQSIDVTSQVSWSVSRDDDTPPGSVTNGAFTSAPGAGGTVHVTVTDGCLSASVDVAVTYSGTISAGDGGVMASDFMGTVDTTTTASWPRVVYPHDETRFPRNIYKVLFQWQRASHSRFRLTFAGPASTVVVLTDGAHPQCTATTACWEADVAAWLGIAGSNAGSEVTFTVDGVDTPGGTVFRAPAIRIGFSRRDVRGAIFYWSTTSAGVRRATVSDSAPEPYVVGRPVGSLLADGSRVQCVACHTVSRSGRKLFAGTKTSIDTGLFVYDVTLTAPPIPIITDQISTRDKGFGTFSPDDQRVVATVGDLLGEFDSTTGAQVVMLPVAAGTNPDWSPLGHELVYSNRGGDSPGGAALAVIAREDGGWGASRTLVPAGTQTALFPSFAPDGLHVAYTRGRGGHGDRTFQLWLIGADGGDNTELLAANRKVNNCLGIACDALGMTNGQYENTMPTWAPPGDLDWVAFNSQRPYGVVYPTGGVQQIWVAAVDRSKVGQRLPDGGLVDPSYPAFRFAFQDLGENNHRAFWTLDVRMEVDAGACVPANAMCTPSAACCGNNVCVQTGEFDFTCQTPGSFDAGRMCVATGATCMAGVDTCCDPVSLCVPRDGGGAWCESQIN